MANAWVGSKLHLEEASENRDAYVSERVVEAPDVQQRKVRVRIMRACHLLPANGPEDTSPFCQISDRTHQGSTALRTRTIENCVCPVWNESFELELDEGYCFELALYCRGRWFFDHFLGSKKVVLPNAISDLGGTIVKGEERLVTLILDKTPQGFLEVGITPLNYDYGPTMRGERKELSNMRRVWELHSIAVPAEPSDRKQKNHKRSEIPGRREGAETDTLWASVLERKQSKAREESRPSDVKGDGWLSTSILSSLAALPYLHRRVSAYVLPPPDRASVALSPHPLASAKPKTPSFTYPSASTSTATTSSSSSSSSPSSPASYLQLLPPELIATIGKYVERNTPFNPFDEWREEERARFKEATRKRKKNKAKTTKTRMTVQRNGKQRSRDRHNTGWWREMRVPAAPSGSMRSTRLDMSMSLFDLPSFPLSPKIVRHHDAAEPDTAQVCTASTSAGEDELEPRERVSEITFLCTAAMKRYAFKDKRKPGLSLRQYILDLDDAPLCSGLLRNDKYTLCNLFAALGEDFHKWEFFLIRNLGKHKLGTVVERERDMVIGGYHALGCTFVTTSTSLSASHHHQTFNCVTNFFVAVGGEDGDRSEARVVFNFQYVTCWTKGLVSRALANHHERERRTFYWMLRSVAFT
ncbi:C2 domain containing protein [Acanthamoeba castellanii str. Neff]|uniref:C2 domain containing protein n=1 Tax=Acanthamoeba castellanii (strain ATCC 30010 / Neff) TaxID=1257118 RepID=L8GYW6_ACACF|nr:C2 domain containing protein [Acanthamoeba castellanii str. Neff]ELR18122.1 C2 domain containing protein [Acanthamoeba castellanii str. Neff]